jgi:hypothetical protein
MAGMNMTSSGSAGSNPSTSPGSTAGYWLL